MAARGNDDDVKAWQLTAPSEPLQLIERDDPHPGAGEVVVHVRAAGICHSDVGFLDGTLTGMLAKLLLVLGHELAGVVSEVGPDVDAWAVGDRVAALGDPQHSPGWSVDGGFADKYLASASGLVKLPDAVDFVQAAAATDAGQTAYGAVMGAGRLRAGERVGVISPKSVQQVHTRRKELRARGVHLGSAGDGPGRCRAAAAPPQPGLQPRCQPRQRHVHRNHQHGDDQ